MLDINEALQGAKEDGVIDQGALDAFDVVDLGTEIQDNLGATPDDIDSNEVFFLIGVVDDSSSIRFAGNTQAVKDGYNRVLAELKGSQARDDILVMTTQLNRGPLHTPCPLVDAPLLTNYNPSGGTPLYDQAIAACKVATAKYKEFTDTGADFRGVIFLISDGNDEGSRASIKQARAAIEPLLLKEIFGFIALGIDDGYTDFEQVFSEMGIPKEWILTVKSDGHAIREACGVVSRATQSASQSGGSLSQHSGLQDFTD